MQLVSLYSTFHWYATSVLSSTVAANTDYTHVDSQVVFAIGEYTKNITIPILADSEVETEEIFNVQLNTDCCADIIIGQVQVNITDGK